MSSHSIRVDDQTTRGTSGSGQRLIAVMVEALKSMGHEQIQLKDLDERDRGLGVRLAT